MTHSEITRKCKKVRELKDGNLISDPECIQAIQQGEFFDWSEDFKVWVGADGKIIVLRDKKNVEVWEEGNEILLCI